MSILSNTRKVLIIILTVFIIVFALAVPFSTRNIDKLAYVIALGIDVRSK